LVGVEDALEGEDMVIDGDVVDEPRENGLPPFSEAMLTAVFDPDVWLLAEPVACLKAMHASARLASGAGGSASGSESTLLGELR
jgi:hypothetical protein